MSSGRDRKISVEKGVGGGRPVVAEEIHDRESKIVEHVDRRDHRIELDRIEQHGLLPDQHDIRQMQVAVATPHISLPAAPLQQSAQAGKRGQGGLFEVVDRIQPGSNSLPGMPLLLPSMMPGIEWIHGSAGCERRAAVGGRDRFRNGVDEGRIERTGFGQMIEGSTLVEAGHFNGEFDRRAWPVDLKRSVVDFA